MRTATQIRLGACPGWSESSLDAHTILLVLSWGGSHNKNTQNGDFPSAMFSLRAAFTNFAIWIFFLEFSRLEYYHNDVLYHLFNFGTEKFTSQNLEVFKHTCNIYLDTTLQNEHNDRM